MLEKESYQLRKEDFDEYPVWYLPCDESVEDETVARPLTTEDFEEIFYTKDFYIKAEFVDSEGNSYPGFIQWAQSDDIGYLQPDLFLENEVVSFWFGMKKPDWTARSPIKQELRKRFPIEFKSMEYGRAYSITGTLEGLYYIDMEEDVVKCVK